MAFNIPVVASSYPAVAEAVGQLQPSLCPYINSPDEWSELVNQALRCETEWKQLAADRCAELKVRETVELVELQSFLETQTDVR